MELLPSRKVNVDDFLVQDETERAVGQDAKNQKGDSLPNMLRGLGAINLKRTNVSVRTVLS